MAGNASAPSGSAAAGDDGIGRIADAVCDLLAEGLVLPPDAADFVTSAIGDESLADAVNDEEHEARDMLLDYLLFPGMEFQVRLESRLREIAASCDQLSVSCAKPVIVLSSGETERLAAAVGARNPRAVVLFSEEETAERPMLTLPFPSGHLRSFIRRLRLDCGPRGEAAQALCGLPDDFADGRPGDLTESLPDNFPNSRRDRALVLLRNLRMELTPERERFLAAVVRERGSAPVFPSLWECALRVLQDSGPSESPQDTLAARRSRLEDALRISGQTSARLKARSPEAVMLSGERVLAVNEEETRRELAGLDMLSMTVWGSLPPGAGPVVHDSLLGEFGDGEIERMIRLLS